MEAAGGGPHLVRDAPARAARHLARPGGAAIGRQFARPSGVHTTESRDQGVVTRSLHSAMVTRGFAIFTKSATQHAGEVDRAERLLLNTRRKSGHGH
jgi:hypothetical protein